MSAALLHAVPVPAADVSLLAWLNQAEPGDVIEYHRGFLALDRSFDSATRSADDRIVINQIASLAMRLSDRGLVDLVQRRVGGERFAYLAIARQRDGSLAEFLEAGWRS